MKGAVSNVALLVLCLLLLGPPLAQAADPTQEAILQELRALKQRVSELENKLSAAQKSAEDAQKAAAEAYATSGRSLKMSQQVAKTKDKQPAGLLSEAGKRLKIYGAIEL